MFEKIDEETLKRDITDELFERDYGQIAKTIAEYRKAHAPKTTKTKTGKKTRRKKK